MNHKNATAAAIPMTPATNRTAGSSPITKRDAQINAAMTRAAMALAAISAPLIAAKARIRFMNGNYSAKGSV